MKIVKLKNKNNEEVIPESIIKLKNYSFDEILVGTWIDGKPIYRKVINVDSLPNAARSAITLNIDYDKIITVRGIAYNSSVSFAIPWADGTTLNNVVKGFVQDGSLIIDTGTDRTGYSAFFILEYTKITD